MRRLGRTGRIALAVVLGIVILWLLFTVVFPWVERQMEDPTLGTGHTEAHAV